MNKLISSLLVSLIVFSSPGFTSPLSPVLTEQTSGEPEIVLTGFSLSIEEIVLLSERKVKIRVTPEGWERVNASHALLLAAAKEDKPVYGLNRGVGLNKDKSIFEGDALSPQAKTASIEFNKNNLRATSSAAGSFLPQKVVRAVLAVKLNSFLQGTTGVQPKAAHLLLQLIEKDILPLMPDRGSIGESDITILSHLGLTLMGEGDVFYQDKQMSASEAFALSGLTPLVPFAKDSLSIMSSNAYSVAVGALLLHDAEELMNKADLVFSVSLEGLNGNIAPFLKDAQEARPYPGQKKVAEHVLEALKNSSLWEKSEERALQDPLSFRNVSQVHGTTRELVERAKEKLLLHLRSSDDNPVTVLNPTEVHSEQERSYYLQNGTGAVIPTANFDTINWTIDFEALGIALSHVSQLSSQRMLRLSSEKFTHLTRFLSPNDAIVFGAMQKTFIALNTENHSLSLPVSFDSLAAAGEIEDHSTNAPLVLQRLCKMLDNLYYILGMELMHGSQAVDLRKQSHPAFHIGCVSGSLYTAYREAVSFIDRDRSLSGEIEKSHDFLATVWGKRILTPDCLFKDIP